MNRDHRLTLENMYEGECAKIIVKDKNSNYYRIFIKCLSSKCKVFVWSKPLMLFNKEEKYKAMFGKLDFFDYSIHDFEILDIYKDVNLKLYLGG